MLTVNGKPDCLSVHIQNGTITITTIITQNKFYFKFFTLTVNLFEGAVKIIVNVKINLTFTIIFLFILPCTSDDFVIYVHIG